MKNKFNLSILGYRRNLVENKLNINENEHRESVKKLEDELLAITCEVEDLKGQIQKTEKEIQIQKKEWETLEKSLFNEYMQDTKRIFDTLENAARIKEEKQKDLSAYDNEGRRLKNTGDKLINDIKSRVEEYKEKFEANNIVGAGEDDES